MNVYIPHIIQTYIEIYFLKMNCGILNMQTFT